MSRRLVPLVVGCLLGPIVATLCFSVEAKGRAPGGHRNPGAERRAAEERQRRSRDQAQQQLESAKTAAGVADSETKKAREKVEAVDKRLADARAAVSEAKKKLEEAIRDQRKVEQEVLDGQSPSSTYGEAKGSLEKAAAQLKRAEEQVKNSPAFKEKWAEASRAEKPAIAQQEFRRQALQSDPNYFTANHQHDEARGRLARVQQEVLAKSSKWTEAQKAVQDARAEVSKADREAASVGSQRAQPAEDLKTATKNAAALQAKVRAAEDRLRALGGAVKKKK